MEAVLYITGGVALLALAAFILYMITFVKETKIVVANVGTTLKEISAQVDKQLNHLDGVAKNVTNLTDDISAVVDDTTVIIHEGQRIIISILELEQTLQKAIEEPVVEAATIFSALGKGMRAVRMKIANSIDGPVGAELAGLNPDRIEQKGS